MSSALIAHSARELVELLNNRAFSAETVTAAFLDQIHAVEPQIQAFLTIDAEGALSQARAIDARRQRGEPVGGLAGLPIAIKDLFCTRGQRTTAGSKMLTNFVPPYDAGVVERLRRADAVLIGKTNLDEFAMGSSTENSAFQVTRNPWDLERIPGGSSGGSAAAVAARQVPFALGSDTGGSIRQPAALCGVVGMKPSYGRVSRFGMIAFGSSLDQIGPLARNVGDAALLLETIAGHDPRDSTSVDRAVPAYSQTVDQALQGLRVGVPAEFFGPGLDEDVAAAVRKAIDVYRGLGASVVEVSLPHSPLALAAYYIVATAEASSNLARYDGVHFGHRAANYRDLAEMVCRSRGEGFGAEVKRRIMLGTYVLSSGYQDAYYRKALQVRRLIRNDFEAAFAVCDVIAGPTSPSAAFKIGQRIDDPLQMYLVDIYTVTCNLAGVAGISIPCGFTGAGLPIGLQLLAAPFEEEKLLRAARMHEQATDWHTRAPLLQPGRSSQVAD